jgi:hypothetical protein
MVFAGVGERSSQYCKFDWPLMNDPTIFSPLSFPQTSAGCQELQKLKGEGRTFENDGFLRAPDVAKCPRTLY